MKQKVYAVVMAGGKGTRFWPLSRPHHPKQLLRLFSEKSLLRETVDRLLPEFGPHRTLVVCVKEHARAVMKELPFLPKANFLIEPQGKNTAPCIGLAAAELMARDPRAVMVVVPADHWISDPRRFRRTLKAAAQLAQRQDALIALGIRPAYPETGYGYILKGRKATAAHQVNGFVEKPGLQEARRLMRRGALWNSGIFVWRASTILESLGRYSPEIANGLDRIRGAAHGRSLSHKSLRPAIRQAYRKMPNISIDYAVMEKAASKGRVLALQADFDWSDVGNWAAVHRMMPKRENGNAGVGRWLAVKSSDCLIHSRGRLVAVLGLKNVAVVETPDAVLVADMNRAQEVRGLVEELNRKGYRHYTA